MKARNSEYFASVKQDCIKAGYLNLDVSNFNQEIFDLQDKYLDRYKNNVQGYEFPGPDSLLS